MKAYIMGNYTEKAFQGFIKDPSSDRKAVVKQLTEAMGGTMHSMDIVRGSYDFIVVTDVPSFDDFAAIKLVVEASGAVENFRAFLWQLQLLPHSPTDTFCVISG